MRVVTLTVMAALFAACASTVIPARDGGDTGVDAIADTAMDHTDVQPLDVPAPNPCGDAGICGAGQICVRGRCAGCCDEPPRCEPIPTGCSGALACGCFTRDPCAGCNTCLTVDVDGIQCGNCMCTCAAPWTPIETPDGPRPISELQVGDLVYSVDHGARIAVPIARTIRRAVVHHAVVRIALANGAVLEISGRHPTADGRALDSLQPGDRLGDALIVSVETVPYEQPFTYDILPASDTGAYFAAGALVGSTLHEEVARP